MTHMFVAGTVDHVSQLAKEEHVQSRAGTLAIFHLTLTPVQAIQIQPFPEGLYRIALEEWMGVLTWWLYILHGVLYHAYRR